MNGANTNEVWRFLRRNTKNLHNDSTDRSRVIPWNFTKFVLNVATGEISYFDPRAKKADINKAIEKILNE